MGGDGVAVTVELSVVVTHYEQPDQLARMRHALARQQGLPAWEVIVADDGSPSGVCLAAWQAPDPDAGHPSWARPPVEVRTVSQPHDGFGAARIRSYATSSARGTTVVFLDCDTLPEPRAVRRLVDAVRADRSALVTGRRRHADLSGLPCAAPVESLPPQVHLTEPSWLAQGHAASRGLRIEHEGNFRYVLSAVMAADRDRLVDIGGFDESFSCYGGEDWELAWRWWCAGGRLRHEPGAVAWHDGPAVGEDDRDVDRTAKLAEALALIGRVGAVQLSPRGLRLGPPGLTVSLGADIEDEAAFITVDSLLAGLPQALVCWEASRSLDRSVDPRLHPTPPKRPAPWHLHLGRAVIASPQAWRSWRLDCAGLPRDRATAVLVGESVIGTVVPGYLAQCQALTADPGANRGASPPVTLGTDIGVDPATRLRLDPASTVPADLTWQAYVGGYHPALRW